jgi:hypothetical protein
MINSFWLLVFMHPPCLPHMSHHMLLLLQQLQVLCLLKQEVQVAGTNAYH